MNVDLVCAANRFRVDLFADDQPAYVRFTTAGSFYLEMMAWEAQKGSGDFRLEVLYARDPGNYTLPSTPFARATSESRTGYFEGSIGAAGSISPPGWVGDMTLDEIAAGWTDILVIVRPKTGKGCAVAMVIEFAST